MNFEFSDEQELLREQAKEDRENAASHDAESGDADNGDGEDSDENG